MAEDGFFFEWGGMFPVEFFNRGSLKKGDFGQIENSYWDEKKCETILIM